MLDLYIGECMVSIININNGFKETTHGYQNCSTNQILIFHSYVERILYTRFIICKILSPTNSWLKDEQACTSHSKSRALWRSL
jgi:hypothetical protein